MPSFRLPADNRRRRSSAMLIGLNPAKPGTYGIGLPPPSQKPVMFAPNVTPVTYVEPEDNSDSAYSPDASAALFPPSEAPSAGPVRRRAPPGKRRSQGYIPRPPNAFMLFRADFVRQKHVPGSIETNHGSLSKIIGNCWRALPLEEKRVWEVKAKHAKAEHKAKYPNYRFRPVHNKNKEKKKEKPLPMPEDERRCEEVAQLLLEGKKGDELAEAVRNLDRLRSLTPVIQPAPLYTHRRSSSVPLPNDYYNPYANISIPSAPFFMPSRPASPMSRQQRMLIGQRRPSSAGPAFFRSWTMPNPQLAPAHMFQHDTEPLPEPDPTLFNTFSNFNFQSSHPEQPAPPFNVNELMTSLPPHGQAHDTHLGLGPLDSLGPQDILHMYNHTSPPANNNPADASELEMTNWLSSSLQHSPSLPSSHTSSTYSGSPQPPDKALPLPVFAPQPVHPDQTPTNAMFGSVENMGPSDVWSGQELGYGNATNMAYSPESTGCAPSTDFAFSNGFEFGDFVKNEA